MSNEPNNPSWFEKPANVNLLIGVLVIACAVVVLADFFYTNDHPHFETESWFGFQAWFGFLSFAGVVFLGRLLRVFIRREEDYYDQ